MLMINKEKAPEDILKEEFLQERAAVLGRAGEKVSNALETLHGIEKTIQEQLNHFNEIVEKCNSQCDDSMLILLRRQAVKEINIEINRFNRAREHAKLKYYYLRTSIDKKLPRLLYLKIQNYFLSNIQKYLLLNMQLQGLVLHTCFC